MRRTAELFTPEQIAIGGAFLEIEHDGALDIRRGYVKPEDSKAAKAASTETKDAKASPPTEPVSRNRCKGICTPIAQPPSGRC